MKSYRASIFGNVFVRGDPSPRPLPPRLDLRRFALGYAWGYVGGGSSQLSLAILCDVYDDEKALAFYERFRDRVIATQHRDAPFEMTAAKVMEHVEAMEKEQA